VTFVAELVGGIGSNHSQPETSMGVVAIVAPHPPLLDGMARLFMGLDFYAEMAGET